MQIIQDLWLTNKKIFKRTVTAVMKNPLLFVIGIPYMFVALFVGALAMSLPFIGGILASIMEAAIVSNYLFLMYNIIKYSKFDLDDFKNGFKVYFINVYMVLIFLYLVNYAIRMFIVPINSIMPGNLVLLVVNLAMLIFFSALPETIYLKHYSGGEMISYAVKFVRENAIQWLVPIVVLMSVIGLVSSMMTGMIASILFGVAGFLGVFNFLLLFVVGQFFFGFMMIYRGFLYDVLSTSSLRKRMFMREMDRD